MGERLELLEKEKELLMHAHAESQGESAKAVHAAAIAAEQINGLKEELQLERAQCAELRSSLTKVRARADREATRKQKWKEDATAFAGDSEVLQNKLQSTLDAQRNSLLANRQRLEDRIASLLQSAQEGDSTAAAASKLEKPSPHVVRRRKSSAGQRQTSDELWKSERVSPLQGRAGAPSASAGGGQARGSLDERMMRSAAGSSKNIGGAAACASQPAKA